MKCPACSHVSDTVLLKCPTCGEAYERDALETLQHIEYLLAWLDERAEALEPETHTRLRGEAVNQLDDLRSTLHLPPMPSSPEIASKLGLVEAMLHQFQGWVEAAQIGPASLSKLQRLLSARTDTLRKQLGSRPVEAEPPSDLQVLDFALESLPRWAKGLELSPVNLAALRHHLDLKRTALLQPIAHELALVEATRQQLQGWVEAAQIGAVFANELGRHLSAHADGLKEEIADRPVLAEAPSALQVLDFALASLPQWAGELGLRSTDVASLYGHLDRRRTALLRSIARKLALVDAANRQIQVWAETIGVGFTATALHLPLDSIQRPAGGTR